MSKVNSSELFPNMTRRSFIRGLGALGACGLIENQLLAQVFTGERHISRLAARPPSREGVWMAQRIER